MKKFIIIILSVLSIIVNLVGCSENTVVNDCDLKQSNEVFNNEKIKTTIKEDKITRDTESITLVLENETNKEYFYGLAFTLEAEKEGKWCKVPFKENISFIEIAIVLKPYKTNEEKIELNYFKKLPVGKYRIVKAVSTDGEGFNIGAEFEVVDK